ncbi:MAG: DUF1266 domain-containing protein [Gulosibacter sp.]|uniref:DUF1266 domain-containing protein n=1 Tax=Gulosibacter sp. TaxID=2817531 RepID=UPI003F8FBB9A
MTGEELSIVIIFVLGFAVLLYFIYIRPAVKKRANRAKVAARAATERGARSAQYGSPGEQAATVPHGSTGATTLALHPAERDRLVGLGAQLRPNNDWRALGSVAEVTYGLNLAAMSWVGDPSTFQARSEHWDLALTIPFAGRHGVPWDDYPGYNPEEHAVILVDWWGVHDRSSLLDQLFWLFGGGHRREFDEERIAVLTNDAVALDEWEATLRRQAPISESAAETLWRVQRFRANDRNCMNVDFLAWDFFRFAMLTRIGVGLGYLTTEEGLDFLRLIGEPMRTTYSSWADAGEHFRIGRWMWYSVGGEKERATDVQDVARQQQLIASDSPWSFVPWNMALEHDRGLFAKALVEQELIVRDESRGEEEFLNEAAELLRNPALTWRELRMEIEADVS